MITKLGVTLVFGRNGDVDATDTALASLATGGGGYALSNGIDLSKIYHGMKSSLTDAYHLDPTVTEKAIVDSVKEYDPKTAERVAKIFSGGGSNVPERAARAISFTPRSISKIAIPAFLSAAGMYGLYRRHKNDNGV